MTHIVLPSPTTQPSSVALPGFITDIRPPRTPSALALTRAADLAGLDGIVIPDRPTDPEPLMTAGALLRITRYVQVVAGISSWVATPQYAAKLSASLQRFSGGRLGWLFATDDDGADDFIRVARDFWTSPEGLPTPLRDNDFPAVYIGTQPFFVSVGHDPGQVLRLGEELATGQEQSHVH
ncbi:MAG: LLM class flavin-dependent oxidoreductase [Gordonia sp. (in: high G+C Gram-positive bacteria)]